jgi:hypothetical protein
MTLYVRKELILVSGGMSVREVIISDWEKLCKRNEGKVRPMVRRPSVPIDYLYNCSRISRNRCCHKSWWINRRALCKPTSGQFSVMRQFRHAFLSPHETPSELLCGYLHPSR